MKKKIEKVVNTTLFLFFFPCVSYAATLASIANEILKPIRVIPRLLFALALVYFLSGLLQYTTGIEEKKRIEARDRIGYGLLGLFVMASTWGLVDLVLQAFDLK
jgi:hypothetical protein